MPSGIYIRTKECNIINSESKKGRKHTQETKDKISISVLESCNGRIIPLEVRYCECPCNQSFTCKVNSKQRFISGHNLRCQSVEMLDKAKKAREGYKHTQKTKDKIGEGNTGKVRSSEIREQTSKFHTELWKDPKYRDFQIKAIMAGSNKKPNNQEMYLFSIVDTLFPGKYLLNVKGEHARPAGKLPDIVNIKDKKVIELYGDYWHADPKHWKLKGITWINGLSLKEIHKKDKNRINLIEKAGWKVLVVWNHEFKDLDELEEKIIKFQGC